MRSGDGAGKRSNITIGASGFVAVTLCFTELVPNSDLKFVAVTR